LPQLEPAGKPKPRSRLRRWFFWIHLSIGVLASAVILLMCVTGTILAFQRQIVAAADAWHSRAVVVPASGAPLPVNGVTQQLSSTQEPLRISSITVWSDLSRPLLLEYGSSKALYVDPYSGAVLGEGSQRARQFFRTITELHRWLAAKGDLRNTGRAITGACNLLFVGLMLTGVVLWMPRRWSWAVVRGSLLFRRGLRGKARDWNWHNVIAIWSVGPLAIIAVSGVVMSYPWANNAVYRITGNQPPPPATERQQQEGGRGEPREHGARSHQDPAGLHGHGENALNLEPLLSSAERQVPEWKSVTLRLTEGSGPVTAVVLTGPEGRPDDRTQLTLDRATATVTRSESFATYKGGRRLRGWLRFAHTGEAAGVPGQVIAGVATLGGSVLVCTGIALALRRLAAALRRRET